MSDESTVRYRDHVHTRKALVATTAIVCFTVLMFADRLDAAVGFGGILSITTYILGNGVSAYKGDDVQPIIRSKVRYGRRAGD